MGVLGFVEKVVNILLWPESVPFEQFVESSNSFSELEITVARKRKGEVLEGGPRDRRVASRSAITYVARHWTHLLMQGTWKTVSCEICV